jgi:hypothetical protein
MSRELNDSTVNPEEERPQEELAAQVELLREENQRLREEYARARRSQYRQTAIALASVGIVSILGGILFPASQQVLVALGGTGLFAAILTYYLTPEAVIPATVGERVYSAFAATATQMIGELGLSGSRLYVPTGDGESAVRLYVPQETPVDDLASLDLERTFVVGDRSGGHGVAVDPTGGALFDEFERALAGELGEQPAAVGNRLAEALVEQFELVDSAVADSSEGQVVIAISGSVYGPIDRFDHPVPSFLAVGLARSLKQPISLTVTQADDDRADSIITCAWETAEENAAPTKE